jgi:low affinity Fe/Cu permease
MSFFSQTAQLASNLAGHARTFVIACLLIVIWGVTGPLFGWSDTWQLVVNTATSIITFLMVFLLQHTQNRDTIAMQLKLDALIDASEQASDRFIGLEGLSEAELQVIRSWFVRVARGQWPAGKEHGPSGASAA